MRSKKALCFLIIASFCVIPQITIASDSFMWGISITWPYDLTRCSLEYSYQNESLEVEKIMEVIDRIAETGGLAEKKGGWLRLHLVWSDIEPIIQPPYIDYIGDIDDEVVNRYLDDKDWSKYDKIVNYASEKGVNIIFILGAGFVRHTDTATTTGWPMLPILDDQPITIDNPIYKASLVRYTRAAVKRYKNYVKIWQLENELNTAGQQTLLTKYWRWRTGFGWFSTEFQLRLLQLMSNAVKKEDKWSKVFTNFHFLRFDLIDEYAPFLDWIGLDLYWDQVFDYTGLLYDLSVYPEEDPFSFLNITDWGDKPDIGSAINHSNELSEPPRV